MAKSVRVTIRCVAAGSVILATAWAASAQDAASPQAQQTQEQAAQDQSTQAVPAQQPCSVLGCLFSSRNAQSQQAPPAEAAAAPSQDPAQTMPATPQEAALDDVPAPKSVPKPKPVHPVTIAADAAEAGRLKGLVAAMPKGKVKIVKATSAEGQADFLVSAVLDSHDIGDKAKLFTEQMHIVAGGQIHAVADLKDKVVSFGPDKSASQAAARKAFEALNIPVKETPLDLDNALDGLATGDVAAVVVLAPQPFARFESLSAPGLHLVSWPQDGVLPTGAVATTIDPAQYPGLAKPDGVVRAVGIDAVLKISAKGERQPACKTFLSALAQHSAALSKHGFDLLKADLETRTGRRFASDDPR